MTEQFGVFPHGRDGRRQVMRTPDEVATMLRLHGLGWSTRRIAAEVGCNRETVQRYVAAGGWAPCRVPARPSVLAGHTEWVAERRWCTELTRAGDHPSPAGVQATRAETGLAVRVMRFSTETANAASPCWPGSVRARSRGPIRCFQRPLAVSASARRP